MEVTCAYLTQINRYHYDCLYHKGRCGKKANFNIMCPTLKVELKQGKKDRKQKGNPVKGSLNLVQGLATSRTRSRFTI